MFGGRWNSKGTSILYTSQSRALSLVELAVRIPTATMPKDFVILTIEVPGSIEAKTIAKVELPPDWNKFPHSEATQKIGDQFILDQSCLALKVPSAVVPEEFNYLLNPNHADFGKVEIVNSETFVFDKRLFKTGKP